MSPNLLLVIIGILVVTNLFSLYRTVDSGVTITYMRSSLESHHANKRALGRITVELAADRSEQDIVQAVKRALPKERIEREGDILYVGEVGLKFRAGRLAHVVFMNDPPEDDSTEPR